MNFQTQMLESIKNEDLKTLDKLLTQITKRKKRSIVPSLAVAAIEQVSEQALVMLRPYVDAEFWLDESIWKTLLAYDDAHFIELIFDFSGNKTPTSIEGQPFLEFAREHLNDEDVFNLLT